MSVLVAVDFSPPSRRALDVATRLAQDMDVPLVVVHAFGRAPLMPPGSGDSLDPIAALYAEGKQDEARRLTDEVMASVRRRGVEVELVAEEGTPKAVLADAIQAHKPLLVVCGHHSSGSHLGSVAKWLLDEAERPVVVVPG